MIKAFEKAFAEWERRYRTNPSEFLNHVERLLGHTTESIAELQAAYLVVLLNELAGGKPWDSIQ